MSSYRLQKLYRSQVKLGLITFSVSMFLFTLSSILSDLFVALCAAGEIIAFLGFIAVVLMGYHRIEVRLDEERRELGLE